MPTLMLRGLPAELVSRLKAYAKRRDLSDRDAAERLIESGLRASEKATANAETRAQSLTPEQRSEIARKGGLARSRE